MEKIEDYPGCKANHLHPVSGKHHANSPSDTDFPGSFSHILDSVAMKTEAACSSKNLGHTIII